MTQEYTEAELFYRKRIHVLFAALANTYREISWKTKCLIPGVETWNGSKFLAGIDTPKGTVWEMLPRSYWEKLNVEERNCAKDLTDGSFEELIESLCDPSMPEGGELLRRLARR